MCLKKFIFILAIPDTRALACIGSLCTEKVAVTDVVCHESSEEVGLFNLTQAIVDGLQGCAASFYATIETENAVMRRLPTAEPVSTLRLSCNNPTYLLLGKPL